MKDLEERLKSAEDLIRVTGQPLTHQEWRAKRDAHFEKYEPKDPLIEIWGSIYENIDSWCGDNEAIWNSEFKQILPLITEAKRQGAIEVLEELGCGQAVIPYKPTEEERGFIVKTVQKYHELKENR